MTIEFTYIKPVVPVIEGGSGKKPKSKLSVWNDKHQQKFTVAELELIRKLSLMALDAITEVKQEAVEFKEELWLQCNPDDPESIHTFKELNFVKQKIRKMRKDRSSLASILSKIKKQKKNM